MTNLLFLQNYYWRLPNNGGYFTSKLNLRQHEKFSPVI